MSLGYYRNKEALLRHCRAEMNGQPVHHETVHINHHALEKFASGLKRQPVGGPAWDDYLSPEALAGYETLPPVEALARVLQEFAISTAQNAGYVTADAQGAAHKWELNDSGSKGLLALYKVMVDLHWLPGIHIGPRDVDLKLRPILEGAFGPVGLYGKPIPFIEERLEIFKELAAPTAKDVFHQLAVESLAKGGGERAVFDFDMAEKLARAFPKSFGADPFRKKANLVPILAAANARAHGLDVTVDCVAAADYRLPQTLQQLGILQVRPEIQKQLDAQHVFNENDETVTRIRAATILAVDEISKLSGVPVDQIESALWLAVKKQPPSTTISQPVKQPMMVETKHLHFAAPAL